MPLSRVIESFDLGTTKFDVVIVDEASQSDVLGLVAFAIARHVAVVGDHEQVSPYAVGFQTETIQGLIDEMLEDIPKHGDLRLKLINHASDPRGLRKETVEPTTSFESEFEELVYKGLTDANYRTVRRCQVGEYVLDIVIEGAGGKRVAVLCDGDRHRAEEELPEVLERQLTLERLGWTFVRVRASVFFRDPEGTLKKLFKRLKEAGIDAIGPPTAEETAATNRGEELKQKVLTRAAQIRRAWKNIPDVPASPAKLAAAAAEESADEATGAEEDEESREAA